MLALTLVGSAAAAEAVSLSAPRLLAKRDGGRYLISASVRGSGFTDVQVILKRNGARVSERDVTLVNRKATAHFSVTRRAGSYVAHAYQGMVLHGEAHSVSKPLRLRG